MTNYAITSSGQGQSTLALSGTISKWTNYIGHWQWRYLTVEDGKLSYFKSRSEQHLGCRGNLSLAFASVETNLLDPCRFDVILPKAEKRWHFKADIEIERDKWVAVIKSNIEFSLKYHKYKPGANDAVCSDWLEMSSLCGTELSQMMMVSPSQIGMNSISREPKLEFEAPTHTSGLGTYNSPAQSETTNQAASSLTTSYNDLSNNNQINNNNLANVEQARVDESLKFLRKSLHDLHLHKNKLITTLDFFENQVKSNKNLGKDNQSMTETSTEELNISVFEIKNTINAMVKLTSNSIDIMGSNEGIWRHRFTILANQIKNLQGRSRAGSSSVIAQKENSNDIQKKLYQNNKGHRRAVSLTTNIPKESSKNLLTSKNQNQKQQTSSSISNQNSANLFDRKISEEPDSFEYSEDEFYDALEEFGKSTPTEIYRLVESKQSKQENINTKIKNNQKAPESKKNNNLPKKISIKKDSSSNSKSLNMPNLNNYSEKIANHRNEHVKSLYPSTKEDKDDQNWVEFHREGDMILCRRSQETPDGRVVDPIRLNHKIDNVSAYECLWYFWDTSVRLEWEHTIESFDILERPDDHTIVLHQWHKRVWPSAKRDAVYLSTIEKYEEYDNSDKITEHDPAYIKGSTWIVTNFSVEHPAMPQIDVSKNNIVRVFINISMICQTFKKDINKPATRDNIYSKVLYISQVDPGGWVPPAALRSVYKREYPSFLKKFGKYVREQTKNKKVVKTGP